MADQWIVVVQDGESRTADDGKVVYVSLQSPLKDFGLAGGVVQYEGEAALVEAIYRNDCCIPDATAMRILRRLYDVYWPSVAADGDAGLQASIDIEEFIDGAFEDSMVILNLLLRPLRSYCGYSPNSTKE